MDKCPRCKCEATGQNRLVTDSCGHSKCRICLLADVANCLECEETATKPIDTDQSAPTTDNHITSTDQGYHCNVCNKSFRSRTQQYYHRACANEMLKKFACTQCSRRFTTRSHLKYHVESHNSNASYCCKQCGKTFKQQCVLQRHMRCHKQVTYCCTHCQRLYRSQSALQAHAVVHTGSSLPFKCDICGKHYLTKANLKQHGLKHEQNCKRYSCATCNKSFLRQSTLKLHQLRHAKRARHACSQCNKSFKDAMSLQRHCQLHDSTQLYRCLECEVTVKRRDNMLRHLRAIHPDMSFESVVEIVDETLTPAPVAAHSKRHSVIKSVGNVEPVQVEAPPQLEVPTAAVDAQQENVKLYRKIILDLDNEEYSNELSNPLDLDDSLPSSALPQQQRLPGQAMSNFSERHWRKNFKYSYEKEHTN
ncbi:CG42726 [Drosophila busckii]|uniref:CG42726 n=1 Tax=Drosophila busckii TaxID=30019 RepID=A0A0M4F656_DROBS|nr:zinc finger protein 90 [Drosophila busckii]ALC47487.1 CG42726 [Drosophila busckii]